MNKYATGKYYAWHFHGKVDLYKYKQLSHFHDWDNFKNKHMLAVPLYFMKDIQITSLYCDLFDNIHQHYRHFNDILTFQSQIASLQNFPKIACVRGTFKW